MKKKLTRRERKRENEEKAKKLAEKVKVETTLQIAEIAEQRKIKEQALLEIEPLIKKMVQEVFYGPQNGPFLSEKTKDLLWSRYLLFETPRFRRPSLYLI